MSANAQFPADIRTAKVHELRSPKAHAAELAEMFHALSQPLTGLHCCLELALQPSSDLSPEQVAERRREAIAIALHQTKKVIVMVNAMRDYLSC